MFKRLFLLFAFLILLCSCWNYSKMAQITKSIPQSYNGIDTLIRIDGYYFGLCENYLCRPFILSENGEFIGNNARYNSHDYVVAYFQEFYPSIKRGSFHIKDDTITVNTTSKYGPWSYDIIKYVFIILDDTTLERIYYSNVRVNDTIVIRDRIQFKFYQYDIQKFK